jgi:hypothetical protein
MNTDLSTEKVQPKPVVDRKWNWLFGVDPDIAITREDRRWVAEQFSEERGLHPLATSWVCLLCGFLGLACFPIGFLILKSLSWPEWYFCFTFFPACAFLMGLGVYLSHRKVVGPLARARLRDRGYDVCLQCGYWLHGLGPDIAQCPECGSPRPRDGIKW